MTFAGPGPCAVWPVSWSGLGELTVGRPAGNIREMAELQLVIFDSDGVLVDSEVISNRVLARLLTSSGLPRTLAETRQDYQGLLLDEILVVTEDRFGHRLPADFLDRFQAERAEEFRQELEPVPGAAEALRRVQAAGPRVCVASQGKLEKTRLTLRLTGLDRLIPRDAVFSAYSVPRGKPHPDLFLHAARLMDAEPAACVVVEDTASGVRAAVAAGMRVLGYAKDSDEAALRGAGAQLFYSLYELPDLLGLDA
jgi:HAD superfamily hydrolase (TIGR01509 family)